MSFLMTILEKSGLYVARAANVKPGEHPAPAQVQITKTRIVSLKDLVAPPGSVVQSPKGFKATAEDVFAAAKISAPENGWTVERFRELALKPTYRDMSPETRQKALLSQLAALNVAPESIVADAVRKDEALDAYERFLQKRLEETQREAAERRKTLEAELAAVTKMEAQAVADFEAWKAAKRAKEKEMAEALEPLMASERISGS